MITMVYSYFRSLELESFIVLFLSNMRDCMTKNPVYD